MFVNIVQFPAVKPGKDAEFLAWFAESSQAYSGHEGFISRRLLKPQAGGNYVAIVEHDSYQTFMAMHTSPTQAVFRERVRPLLDGDPAPAFYEVVAGADAVPVITAS